MTETEAKEKVEALRKEFPDAGSCLDYDKPYCVGGALCRDVFKSAERLNDVFGVDTLREAQSFPSLITIVLILRHRNPALNKSDARIFAKSITDANDDDDIDGAWKVVEKALSYTSPAEHD